MVYVLCYTALLLNFFFNISEPLAQASTMVSSSAPSIYSVQALTLLAEVDF